MSRMLDAVRQFGTQSADSRGEPIEDASRTVQLASGDGSPPPEARPEDFADSAGGGSLAGQTMVIRPAGEVGEPPADAPIELPAATAEPAPSPRKTTALPEVTNENAESNSTSDALGVVSSGRLLNLTPAAPPPSAAPADDLLKRRFAQRGAKAAKQTDFERSVREGLQDESNGPRYRRLAEGIAAEAKERPFSILVAGGEDHPAQCETAAHLAAAVALVGTRVLLVDGSIENKRLSARFEAEHGPGLVEALDRGKDWRKYVAPTSLTNLDLLPAGRGPVTSFRSAGRILGEMIEEAGREYGLTIIDGGRTADAACEHLSAACRVVYVFARLGHAPTGEISESVARLRSWGANIAGCLTTRPKGSNAG